MMLQAYKYPYPTEVDYKAGRRRYGALAEEMPPALVKFLANTYGGAGYPIYRIGMIWRWETTLLHMAFQPTGPDEGRLMAWPLRADPRFNDPVMDRVIGVKRA